MVEQLMQLINEGKYAEVRNILIKNNVVDIAQMLELIDEESIIIVFRLLPKEMAVDVFSYLSYERQQYIIEAITDKEIQNIIDNLFLDDTIDLLEEMPANVVKKILKNTTEDKRKIINQFLNYPENSAGSIMTIEYVDLKKEMTVGQALEHIKKTGVDKETIDVCYVIDSSRKLEGIIHLRKLVLSEQNVVIENIMDTNIIALNTYDQRDKIASVFKKYDLLAMPVVDNENRLVGIITVDDVVDIIEQENTEDFQRMAAMQPAEEEYLKANVFSLAKNRILWLLVLMISATFTGNIIRNFEDVLQSVVVLAAFIPMLMDTGGNAGSQSSTLIIRGLALEEIKLTDFLKVLWKELRVGLIVAIALSGVNFLRILLIEKTDLKITITVCISLFVTVLIAKVVGGILPIIAKSVKIDPAIMAGPLITTIVDAMALITYFSIASMLLGI